jgi:putative ABC transport system permease protein
MLGAQPLLGRAFAPADDRDGAPGTVLLSYGLWNGQFGGDPGAVGRKAILDGEPFTIVGVMPRDFHFPSREAELWTPMRFAPQDFEDRTNTYLHVVAKRKNGVTLEQARAEMGVIASQLERAYPKDNTHIGALVGRLRDEVSAQSRLLLAALAGAAVCVLLIACTNLANLLISRALARRKELAVRSALGAGRERLVRQLLTESLLLALCGGALGVAIAVAALPLLAHLVPNTLPIAEVPSVDLRVLGFAAIVTAITGVAFGVFPALRACGAIGGEGLREGARSGIGGRKEYLRPALVVAEVTVSVVLLVSAGLLLRALWRLRSTDPGFGAAGVLTLRTPLPMPKYLNTARRAQFYSRVLSGVRELPGVTGAAYISFLPMAMRGGIWSVILPGQTLADADRPKASLRFVTPDFFVAMGIPLLAGRDVSESDTQKGPFTAVVSESFVRRYLKDQTPLGRHFEISFFDRTIVGVVGDVRVRGLERDSEPQVYLPYQQVPDGYTVWYVPKDLVVRASGDPSNSLPSVRRAIQAADSELPVSDVRMLADIVGAETGARELQLRVLAAFAAIAFLLAGLGIHGVLSFAVSNRAQEIGVRIALGAQRGDILGMVLKHGFTLAVAGVVFGVGLAYAAGRTLESLLAGVKPGDTATFAAAVVLAGLMTLAGCLLPALRALRVDPMTAIRSE